MSTASIAAPSLTILTPPPPDGFEFVYSPSAATVSDALVGTGAYLVKLDAPRDDWFKWKSGITVPVYLNCRELLANPSARRIITKALVHVVCHIFPNANTIVGLAIAGMPWASRVAEILSKPEACVRTQAKDHGVSRGLVDPGIAPGARIVIIDDLVSSAGSIAGAINALQAPGVTIEGILSIVNWNTTKMRATLKGYKVRSLTSYPWVVESARRAGLISAVDQRRLLDFYRDPFNYDWTSTVE